MAKKFSVGCAGTWFDSANPGVSETGVYQGNGWINTSNGDYFVCVDATIGAQIWNKYPISPVDVAHGGTGLTSTTANQLLYSSGASTIAGLATANNGVLVTDGSGVPSIAAALSTSPAASQTSALSLGAAYQNTFGYDVLLTVYLNITVNAGGNVQCGVGPTNTPTQQTLLTGLAVLGYFPVAIYLPKNYYALLSATVTASITGQQAIPI